jgi:hypothetical protein
MDEPIVSAPLSFTGSARRLWRPVKQAGSPAAKWALGIAVAMLLMLVWAFVLCWYLIWGLWLVPYRLIRRGQRRDKAMTRALGQQPWQQTPQQKPSPWDVR